MIAATVSVTATFARGQRVHEELPQRVLAALMEDDALADRVGLPAQVERYRIFNYDQDEMGAAFEARVKVRGPAGVAWFDLSATSYSGLPWRVRLSLADAQPSLPSFRLRSVEALQER